MILICGDVARPEDYPDCELPPDPNGWFHGRLQIRKFRCQVQMWGVNKGKVTVAAIIDPRVSLPSGVVSFAINRIIGVLLYLIIRTARRVEEEGARPGSLGSDVIELIKRDPYYATHCLPRILWYCERKGWAWPGHPSLPATAPKSEAEALALAGIEVASSGEGADAEAEEELIARGDSEASAASTVSSSASSTRSVVGQGQQGLGKQQDKGGKGAAAAVAVAVAEPLESAAPSSWSSVGGPQQKRKHFLRRLFRKRKHKHHHHKPPPAATWKEAAPAASPARRLLAASGGGGGGKGGVVGKRPAPPALASPPARSATATATAATNTTPGLAAAGPVNQGEAAMWGLVWTLPLLVLGYTLVRAAVAPLVRAHAGAGGEAVVLAVLLQQVTALLSRHGWLPAAAAGMWELKLRLQLSHLVLLASLALAGACLAVAALQQHASQQPSQQQQEWAAAEEWDRMAGARVRAANSGLFLLLLGMVVAGQRKEIGKLMASGGRK
jgi:hypothetical protein